MPIFVSPLEAHQSSTLKSAHDRALLPVATGSGRQSGGNVLRSFFWNVA
jgi:hypothetical protein